MILKIGIEWVSCGWVIMRWVMGWVMGMKEREGIERWGGRLKANLKPTSQETYLQTTHPPSCWTTPSQITPYWKCWNMAMMGDGMEMGEAGARVNGLGLFCDRPIPLPPITHTHYSMALIIFPTVTQTNRLWVPNKRWMAKMGQCFWWIVGVLCCHKQDNFNRPKSSIVVPLPVPYHLPHPC